MCPKEKGTSSGRTLFDCDRFFVFSLGGQFLHFCMTVFNNFILKLFVSSMFNFIDYNTSYLGLIFTLKEI